MIRLLQKGSVIEPILSVANIENQNRLLLSGMYGLQVFRLWELESQLKFRAGIHCLKPKYQLPQPGL